MTPQLMETPLLPSLCSFLHSWPWSLMTRDCAPGPHLPSPPPPPHALGTPSRTRRSPLVRCEPGKAA